MKSKLMKKACVLGHFGFGLNLLNGQTIKTKNVTIELEKQFGNNEIIKIDTHGGIKNLPKCLIELIKAFEHCKNIIIFPAHNGVIVFGMLCPILNKIFHKKIHYVVIGGWLPQYLEDKPLLELQLKKFDGIYVETNKMRRELEKRDFKNINIMPNFKNITPIDITQISTVVEKPYKFCTFSRVMKEKGIQDAIEAIIDINKKEERIVAVLDIYGQIEEGQKEWFEDLMDKCPQYIQYKGMVESSKSVEVLKSYYVLLFPTHFFTEGIPGTIVDAYAAGIPVISSRWESFSDVVDERETGFGYEFGNVNELMKMIKYVLNQPDYIIKMKEKCLEKSFFFLPEKGIRNLLNRL